MSSPGEPDCLFCRIVQGEIPADIVADTATVLAFRDISPVAPTHVLVIPKAHRKDAATLDDGDRTLVADVLTTARERLAISEGIADSGYRLVFNVGEDGHNAVPHLHLHLIGGRSLSWPPG